MSIAPIIVAFLVSLQFEMTVANGQGIEIAFPLAEVSRTRDELQLTRLRQRSGYKRCEFVVFDSKVIWTLLDRLYRTGTEVNETQVTLTMFDDDRHVFVGQFFEVWGAGREPKTYIWQGALIEEPYFKAQFFVDSKGWIKARVDTGAGYYRLTPSDRGIGHYLCELDPERVSRDQRIDANAL